MVESKRYTKRRILRKRQKTKRRRILRKRRGTKRLQRGGLMTTDNPNNLNEEETMLERQMRIIN
jgi:hypothetical protein